MLKTVLELLCADTNVFIYKFVYYTYNANLVAYLIY